MKRSKQTARVADEYLQKTVLRNLVPSMVSMVAVVSVAKTWWQLSRHNVKTHSLTNSASLKTCCLNTRRVQIRRRVAKSNTRCSVASAKTRVMTCIAEVEPDIEPPVTQHG